MKCCCPPRVWAVWLIIFAMMVAPGAPAEGETSPSVQVVRRLHEAFVSVLREAEELRYSGRYDRLTPVITEALDCGFMARAAIGRHWKDLSENDRGRWVTAFRKFTIANYAARLDRYTGQTFETLGEEPGQSETVFVLARVVDPRGEDVNLNYRLHETPAGWKIIDIYANGTVSELALRRSEYASVLKRDGFEALVATVNQKTRDMANGKVES